MVADKLRYSERYNLATDVKARLLRGDISGKRLINLCDDGFVILKKSDCDELTECAKGFAKIKQMVKHIETVDESGEERGQKEERKRKIHQFTWKKTYRCMKLVNSTV